MAKQLPAEEASVTINVTGTNFPENIKAELPEQFSNVVTNRQSSTSLEITGTFNGSKMSPGTTLPMTLTSGRFKYTKQETFEVIEIQPLTISGINPQSIVANGVNNAFTITGTAFSSPSVSISGTGVTFTPTGDDDSTTTIAGTINASIGATPGNRDVSVTVNGETVTLTDGLAITAPITPIDVTNVSPSTLQQGTTQNYTLTGNSFVTGAVASVSGANVTVNSTTFISSTELTANITVGGAAALTQRNLTVTNPDTSNDTLTNAFTVVEASTSIRIEQPTALDGLVVTGNAINFTPTLLSGDAGGTWSSTTLPTGASLNASTGNITGTLSTLGKDFIYLTYTNRSESDTVLLVIHVVDQIATIAGQTVSSPINLANANRAYRLTGNVTADRTAFTMSANDQLLDLNGYTVTYDNEAAIANFSNPDFAGGSTTGWDLSGASDSQALQGLLTAKTAYNNGEYALRFQLTAGQSKYFETTASFTFTAGQWYCISYWNTEIGEGYDVRCVVTVGSQSSDQLGANDVFVDGGGWRPGSFGHYIFKATTTQTVPIRFTHTNIGASIKTVYSSKFDLSRTLCHGIVGGGGGNSSPPRIGGSLSAWYEPGGIPTGGSGFSTVCNGTLTQTGTSPLSEGITVTMELFVDSLALTTRPRITTGWGKALKTYRTWGLYATNCTLGTESIGISSRDNQHGWIIDTQSAGVSGGSLVFRDNTITKSIQGGFSPIGQSSYTKDSIIKYNTVALQSRYTNGFGLYVAGASGRIAECSNNTIDYTQGAEDNGRGIRVVSYATLKNNNITVRSLPLTMEYSGGYTIGGAYAMQLEDSNGVGVGFYNENYTCTGAGGGAAFRVNGPVNSPIDVLDCVFEIDSTTPTPARIATCLKFGQPLSGSIVLDSFDFRNCTLKTNQRLIEIEHSSVTGTLTLTDCLIHIVQDANYGNDLFDLVSAAVVFVNPSYFDSTSETLFLAAVAADARVSIS